MSDFLTKIFKKSVGHVYNQVSQKKIPHFKRGKKLYFSKESLLNYIKEGKILTSKELENLVNETLHNQKKRKKSKGYTQSEIVKKFTSSKDIDHLTNEAATEEASKIHYDANEEYLKNEQ